MAHERIRKFNTRDTYPNQTLDNDLCQMVKARGTLVFVRGQGLARPEWVMEIEATAVVPD
jgi:hypothetical protein